MMHKARLALAGFIVVAVAAVAVAQDTGREERRDQWQKVDEIFTAMGVKPGAVVADVGAGGGYFTTRLSKAVGEQGRVYAIDIKNDVIRRLTARLATEAIKNVEVIQGEEDDPKVPAATLDAALIVNAYHEMDRHQALLAKLKVALKPSGRLVIVEPISESRRTRGRDEQTRNHEIGIDYVRNDARDAGFTEVQAQDPFTTRQDGHGDEWILVLTPVTASGAAARDDAPNRGAPASAKAPAGKPRLDDWKSPALRISPADYKRLSPSEVLVLDVRDPVSYKRGHLPGAVLMTPEELSKPETIARLKSERRRIITYCS